MEALCTLNSPPVVSFNPPKPLTLNPTPQNPKKPETLKNPNLPTL